MDDPTTKRLLEQATRGDARAIDELLVQHLPALHAFIRLRVSGALAGRESSVDLVQSVCREVLENAGDYRYRGAAAFKNWLFTAAMNKIVERHRFHHRDRRDAGREVSVSGGATSADGAAPDLLAPYARLCTPSQDLMRRETMARIERAFSQLPPQYREVITLSRIVGLTYAEIGAETGRTEVAVRGLVARGMARLAELLVGEER